MAILLDHALQLDIKLLVVFHKVVSLYWGEETRGPVTHFGSISVRCNNVSVGKLQSTVQRTSRSEH